MKNDAVKPSYLRDWIYGGVDGAITTFAIVAGVAGGQLSTVAVLVLGVANLIADGFSMAVSNYLGTKSEVEHNEGQQCNSIISKSPVKASFYTFLSFVIFGSAPIIPYVLGLANAFILSCVMTGVVFFIIGSGKAIWTKRSWFYSGFETLIIGSMAAILAYCVAYLLRIYVIA